MNVKTRSKLTARALRFSLAGLLAALGSVGPAGPARAAAPAWAQDGYGPGNTGYNAAESVVNTSTIKKLKLRWKVEAIPGTEGCSGQLTPVVADGRMFMRQGDGVGAYDAKTGRLLWRNTTVMSEEAVGTLTVVGGLVVTTGHSCYSNSDPSGHIAALDVKTGKRRWGTSQGDAIEHVVADAGMIITYGLCGICSTSSVTGYRANDGARKWTIYDVSLASPVSAGGRLLLTGEGGSFAVATTTGKTIWRSSTPWSVLAANPVGDQFYATDPTGSLTALKATNGKAVWSAASAAGILAADGKRVYVSASAGSAAYDAKTGQKLWARVDAPFSRPIRAGGLLYVSGSVLSPTNGTVVTATGYHSDYIHPVVVNGRVLSTDRTGVRAYAP
jgi:outer membrane protein assembly factor BamB